MIISVLGELLLIVALVASLAQAGAMFLPARGRLSPVQLVRFGTQVGFASIALAFALLIYAFAVSDFSLLLVAANSHTAKPLIYKISGTWGNHEGSMLLFLFYISSISELINYINSRDKTGFYDKALSIQGFILTFILFYILLASNPFVLLPQPARQGMGLNPLLQDIGLAMHPPMLYLGYVGFTVAFSFSVVGLLEGKVDAAWATRLKPWVVATLAFLTVGIALGSWWAYRELGWGGFWFWDPVENSSLLPWLCGVALLHSLLVLEKRGMLAGWCCLLGILSYALGLIGFFLVRSGILTSVHSFAVDPLRGVFILGIITLLVGGALLVWAIRAPHLLRKSSFSAASRENFLRINNLLLLILCFTVALGTLYPIFLELFTGARISVGAPYFNSTFNVIALVLALLAVIAPAMAWKKGEFRSLLGRYVFSLALSVVAFFFALHWARGGVMPSLGVAAGVWLAAGMLEHAGRRVDLFEVPLAQALARFKALPLTYHSLVLGHVGVGLLILGISITSGWSTELQEVMKPGDSLPVGESTVRFEGTQLAFGPNYIAEIGAYRVRRSKSDILLYPERRLYPVENQQTTESAINYRVSGDLYVVLGDPNDQGGYATRIYERPGIGLIWCAAATIALGLAFSAMSSRGIMGVSQKSKLSSRSSLRPLKGVSSVLKIAYFTPFLSFMLMMAGFMGGLMHAVEAPAGLAATTPITAEEVPIFSLKVLGKEEQTLTSDMLKKNRYALVNVFASWCTSCLEEHNLLMDLKNRMVVPVYGINWRDDPSEASKWLEHYGNPYKMVGMDKFGEVAIGFGITGAPETFVVGPGGKIVFRHSGPLTREVLEEKILPMVRGRR